MHKYYLYYKINIRIFAGILLINKAFIPGKVINLKSSIYKYSAMLFFIAVLLASYAAMQNPSANPEPVDLGVYPGSKDVKLASEKLAKLQLACDGDTDLPAANRAMPVNITFNSEELTALFSQAQSPLPLTNTQIKLHPHRTVEVSGILLTDEIPSFAAHLGIPEPKALQARDYLNLTRNVPIYIQGNVTIRQQRLNLNISKLKIGKISMQSDEIAIIQNLIDSCIEKESSSNPPGAFIESMIIENSIMTIEFMPPN
ncbi:hypothetical protein ASZ90_019391 [hydrocarbon metagenome]|uniref:Uncharacterized protein n=1 Tax=hydrocarbon metagenome TaxID=938273 RepID=A0A0W8E3R2_9ZZZZ